MEYPTLNYPEANTLATNRSKKQDESEELQCKINTTIGIINNWISHGGTNTLEVYTCNCVTSKQVMEEVYINQLINSGYNIVFDEYVLKISF